MDGRLKDLFLKSVVAGRDGLPFCVRVRARHVAHEVETVRPFVRQAVNDKHFIACGNSLFDRLYVLLRSIRSFHRHVIEIKFRCIVTDPSPQRVNDGDLTAACVRNALCKTQRAVSFAASTGCVEQDL